jgi:hypothetical protein
LNSGPHVFIPSFPSIQMTILKENKKGDSGLC